MGLIVEVMRAADGYDATNGGLSGRHRQLTVVNVTGPFEPMGDRPAFALLDGAGGSRRLVPVLYDGRNWQVVQPEGMVGPMMGGNFAHTSDSRFREAVGFYGAVAVHDRYETVAQYEALSR